MKEKIKSIYNVIDNKFYFKLLYLFVSLTFVTILKCIPKINILSKVVLAWGIILLLFMLFNDYKRRKLYKFDFLAALFIILTFLFNTFVYRSGKNYTEWIINLILFTIIFSVDVFKNKKKLIKELDIITYFYVIFMFIASASSVMMKLLNKSIMIGEDIFGASKGGVFGNQNAISIAASLAIVMCIYLNYATRSYKIKMFSFFNIILQVITMLMFKGRSAALVVVAVIYMFIFVYKKNKYFRAILLIIPVLACFAGFFAEGSHIRDFTSGRTSLWTSASIVVKEHPLTGVGSYNLVESVRNARQTDDLPGLEIGGLHNIYVQTAATNGVIVLGTFLVFIGLALEFIVKHLDKLRKKEKLQMTTLTALIVGILAVNLFESNLIYIVSFISMVFWIYLGYIISILDNKNLD